MRRDITLVNISVFLWGAGDGLFLYIQPLHIEELGADPVQIGWLLGLMRLAAALIYLPSGYLSDRLPRKQLMLGGWGLGVVSTLIFAIAKDWRLLIPGLVLYGLSAYSIPVVYAYLTAAVDGKGLESVFARNMAAYMMGSVLFPFVGGLIAESISMSSAYFAAAGVFGISTLVIAQITPQAPPENPTGMEDWSSVFNRRFLGFVIAVLGVFLFLYLIFPLASNFLADERGMGPASVGALGSVASIGAAVLLPLFGNLRGGWRRHALLIGHGLVWVAAALFVWTVGLFGASLSFMLRGAYSACQSLVQARGSGLLGEPNRGLALGAISTTVVLSQVAASAVAGWLYAFDPYWPFVAALCLIPVGALLTTRLPGGSQE